MNLKPYYDAAQAAQGEVLRVASEIDAAFTLGTPEGMTEAMAKREALDAAQAQAEEALKLYQSMQAAAVTSEHAAKFVPVSEDAGKEQGGKKVITRAEYEAMAYAERHAFFQAGGQIVDNPGE
jgi:hypothetical protein